FQYHHACAAVCPRTRHLGNDRLLYCCIGLAAFRATCQTNSCTGAHGLYKWRLHPAAVWKACMDPVPSDQHPLSVCMADAQGNGGRHTDESPCPHTSTRSVGVE